MILPFSTQLNGKPTYFPEKILTGLFNNKIITEEEIQDRFELSILVRKGEFYEICFDKTQLHKPKLHTIREDKTDRWKPGVMIDFFINTRQPNMFRFAPRIPVVSVQRILMSYAYSNIIHITINGRRINDWQEKEKIAINDGFENWDDFVDYFIPIIEKSEDGFFTGKIIHWTNLKY